MFASSVFDAKIVDDQAENDGSGGVAEQAGRVARGGVINVYTDLFFASYIPQAASAMGYAGLLVMTPLGIISNVILVPFLPIFSRLAEPKDWPELKDKIRQALILTGITMLPLSALMVTLIRARRKLLLINNPAVRSKRY